MPKLQPALVKLRFEAPPMGARGSACKAGTGCSIIRGVAHTSRCLGVWPCPRSYHTSSSHLATVWRIARASLEGDSSRRTGRVMQEQRAAKASTPRAFCAASCYQCLMSKRITHSLLGTPLRCVPGPRRPLQHRLPPSPSPSPVPGCRRRHQRLLW